MRTQFKVRKWITIGVLLIATAAFTYRNDWFFQKSCNVAAISLHGGLWSHLSEEEIPQDLSSSGAIREALIKARDDSAIEAVLISADSSGGGTAAGQEISASIKEVRKPVAVIVGGSALSAAYLAISSADAIFAYEQSEVGSIGITMSYLENVEKNRKDGFSFVELSSGKFKELGNPDKPVSWEERQILQKRADEYYDLMVKNIAENRRLPLERVKSFADGRFFSGVEAKELGLVDEVGTYFDALRLLENKIGKKAEICK